MKQFLFFVLLLTSVTNFFAQSVVKGDFHAPTSNVVKIDGLQNNWTKSITESTANVNATVSGNENVSFTTNSEGIFITILSGTNKIKLFALTGQLLLNGDLTQGRFFIPTRRGIYFLKVNNKSYKVICK